jgi:hypothetical protein
MRRRLSSTLFAAFIFGQSLAAFAEAAESSGLNSTEGERVLLDRMMTAESGGRNDAKNPSSTALGPFQFIEATFLDIIRRNLPGVALGKTQAEVLDLRTDPKISRDAALIYTRENGAFLAARGFPLTPANLRLAFLAGPSGALKVLTAKPDERLSAVLSPAALRANPFLSDMTVAQLIERVGREVEGVEPLAYPAILKSSGASPKLAVRCNLKLASCRKWLALAEVRVGVKEPALVYSAQRR